MIEKIILLFLYSAFTTLVLIPYVIEKCKKYGYMVKDMHPSRIDPVQELEIQNIFDESRKRLPGPTCLRTQETIRKARHQVGLADYATLLVRTGKVLLHLLGLFFLSREEPPSR